MKQHNYFVYITTNPAMTVLCVGVTNDLSTRLQQHFEERGREKHSQVGISVLTLFITSDSPTFNVPLNAKKK
jgi:predicted GIY-YIG superfamily endonuclease